MRKLVLASVGLGVALVGGAFLVPSLIDWNSLKPDLQQAVQSRTHCPVTIQGDVDLDWFPSPTLKVGAFSIGKADTKPVFTAKGLEATVPLLTAFTGDLIAEQVRLQDPVLTLNAARQCANTEHHPQTGQTSGDETGPETGAKIALDNVTIVNGQLSWTYAPDSTPLEVNGFNGDVAFNTILNRLELSGRGNVKGRSTEIETSLYLADTERPHRLNGSLTWPERKQSLRFKAESEGLPPQAEVTGSVVLTAPSGSLNMDADTLPPALTGQEIKVASEYILTNKRLSLNNIDARWGPVHLSGASTMRLGPEPNIETILTVRPLDLDQLLKSSRILADNTGGQAGGKAKRPRRDSDSGSVASVAGLTTALGLLTRPDYTLGLEISIDAVRIGGAVLKDTGFHVAVGDGTVTLDHSRIRLPGGSDLSVLGFLSTKDGRPKFEGGVSFQSDNLRRFLRWTGFPATSVPADRLRSIQVAANLLVEPDRISFPGFSARLDTSNISGSALLTDQPSFSMSIATDVLNLDAYGLNDQWPALLEVLATQDKAVDDTASGTEAMGSGDQPADFDWDLSLSAKHLTLAGRPSSDVSVKLRRSENFVAVENLSIGDFYGIKVDGQASLQQQQVASQLSLTLPSPYRTVTRLGAPSSIRNRLRQVGATQGQLLLAGPIDAMQTDLHFKAKNHEIALRGQMALQPQGLEMQLRDSRIALPNLDLEEITGQASLNLAGDLSWTALHGKWQGSAIQGDGRATAGPKGYSLKTDYTIAFNANAQSFMSIDRYLHFGGDPILSGHLTAPAGFLRNPAMRVEGDGRFSGSLSLAPAQDLAANGRIRQAENLASFIRTHFAAAEAPLKGTLSVKDGRITFDRVTARNPSATADFQGWIDLANNRLSTELSLFEAGRSDAPEFILKARGDLQYPSIKATGKWINGSLNN